MSSVKDCRVNAGGFSGTICVSDNFSPSTGDGGTLPDVTTASAYAVTVGEIQAVEQVQ